MTRRRRQLLNTAEDQRDTRDLDNIAHFEPRRETVGELLRRTREIRGSELEEVATRLRIRPGYLRAIEAGRFQDLPGSTYAVGFVRTYADHLGLDSDEVVRRFRDEVAELNNQTQLIFPVVAAEGKIPRGAILLVSAVLGAIAYGGWYYLSERQQSPLDLIPELPGQLRTLISGEGTPPAVGDPAPSSATIDGQASVAPPAQIEPVQQQPAAQQQAAAPALPDAQVTTIPAELATEAPSLPATAEAPAASTQMPADASADAVADPDTAPSAAETAGDPTSLPVAPEPQIAAVPSPSVPAPDLPPAGTAPQAAPTLDASGLPTVAAPLAPSTATIPGVTPAPEGATLPPVADGQVFGAADAPSRIVLVARLESWVQVTDPETNALLTRVLRAGDRYYVPDEAGLSLATGNAGGLDIWVDGRKLPPLGPVGVVRRGIALDPERLVDGTATSGGPSVP